MTRRSPLDTAAYSLLLASVAVLQLSIVAAETLLWLTLACWALLAIRAWRFEAPAFFWALVAYAAATLISSAFSLNPRISFADSRQLVLFLTVPAVYLIARGERALSLIFAIITVGAASAVYGIFQYGILEYDYLGKRPQGAMGHYMTYSGLVMLVTCAAVARILFAKKDRLWPALILPALLVALGLTFTRSAWVGACVAVGLLLMWKDLRLVALLPVLAALFIAVAPPRITDRVYSVFSLKDPTNRDRVAMLRTGVHIVKDRPFTGVGPDMVVWVYRRYRDPDAVQQVNPHLHNVPMQIAAERGVPALAVWLVFVGFVARDLWRKLRTSRAPSVAAAGLAALAAMLAAGLFEYNFGDSEFLMLFLVLITLPYAADRDAVVARPDGARSS
ncbi:MAG: O-antigen ligase family protein [Acidobacteria bacterium]|nr:O-antigen ligase family protein [Acidobacteriota bacterium]